jgi:short subunit dehydrogenase-like uncharacterized protein
VQHDSEFDIVPWGATAFTGRPAGEKPVAGIGSEGNLRWVIGGRNRAEVDAVSAELGSATADIPIITGDSHDVASLEAPVAPGAGRYL